MGFVGGHFTREDATVVFWLPVWVDVLLMACEIGLLFTGEMNQIWKDKKDGAGSSVTWVLIFTWITLYLNLAALNVPRLVFTIWGGHSQVCNCDDAHDMDHSLLMHLNDSAFMLLLVLRPEKKLKFREMHTEGKLKLLYSPIRMFDVLFRYGPMLTLFSILLFQHGVMFSYPWMTVWWFVLPLYLLTLCQRYRYNWHIKHPPKQAKSSAQSSHKRRSSNSVSDKVIQRAKELPTDEHDPIPGAVLVSVGGVPTTAQSKRSSVSIVGTGFPKMPMESQGNVVMAGAAPSVMAYHHHHQQHQQQPQHYEPPSGAYHPPYATRENLGVSGMMLTDEEGSMGTIHTSELPT